jgi:hypothetical protein
MSFSEYLGECPQRNVRNTCVSQRHAQSTHDCTKYCYIRAGKEGVEYMLVITPRAICALLRM